jgi:glutamate dehydrogenase
MADDHFTFLGFREYKLQERSEKTYLRPVKGTGLGILRSDDRGGRTVELSKEMRRYTRSKDWLIITKANSRSTIHRHSYLDYVGVKIYDSKGDAVGEKRFIGLFTSVAYSENSRNIPLLRLKVKRVLERSEVDPSGHRGKALLHILDSFPRDELFQGSVRDLVRTTNGILNLQDRQRVKFFLRRDTFRRFFSCIVYVPREKYTTAVRRRIEDILQRAFLGVSVDSSVQISDSPLARVHTIVRTGATETPKISILDIEKRIADAVISWRDKLRIQLTEKFGQDEGVSLFREYGSSFRPAYESDTPPVIACLDIKRVDGLHKGEHDDFLLLHKERGTPADQLNFRTFLKDQPLQLSRVLPILEDMGTFVYSERPYKMQLADGDLYWIQDFALRYPNASDLDIDSAALRFQDAFKRALAGTVENDGLERLILTAGLDWRETALVRCYTKFLLQIGIPFSQNYMEDVLVTHANLVRNLIRQFTLQFEPGIAKKTRAEMLDRCTSKIARGVSRAANLDEDRILTAFSGAVGATLRTNYFQRDDEGNVKPCISIKLDSRSLPEVPLPRPKYEIFVYSPRVEGVHLREIGRAHV